MDYSVLAFIGRFQPFHLGHKAVVDAALERAKKVALVIGSHDSPRSPRNPFTTAERIAMISAVYPNEVASGRVQFVPQVDHAYNDARWIAGIQTGVRTVANRPFTPDPIKIGLIGHVKDRTSYYLTKFPDWGSVAVDNVDNIHATDIRNQFFGELGFFESRVLPEAVAQWLVDWRTGEGAEAFGLIRDEFRFISDYKKQWATAPYPPTFHTVDAVVVQSGHVLLVKRGAMPGEGLWALPGGFLNQDETLREGALRELREETRIAVPDKVLEGSIHMQRTFDDPNRSQRGRTITTAFLFELNPRTELPKIKGSDDAAKAQWVPLSNVTRSVMFEDHYDIIESMVGM